jgi:type IV pilus assembly protein PilQ
MVAPKTTGVRTSAAWPMAALALIGILAACAASQTPQPGELPEAQPRGNLTDVRVEREGQTSFVTLLGLEDPVYGVSMQDDARLLVVDLTGVEIEAPSSLIVVYDGLVKHVSLSSFPAAEDEGGPFARVEIALEEEAEFEAAPAEDGLGLMLWPRSGEAQQGDSLAETGSEPTADSFGEADGTETTVGETLDDPWSNPAAESLAPEFEPEPEPELASVPPPTARTLAEVRVTEVSGGVVLHLVADGVIGAMETFTLEDPVRLVVDLPGLASEVSQPRMTVESDQVARVRIGAHADKVRVVIDGAGEAGDFEGRRTMPAADGLFLVFGSGSELEASLASAIESSNAAYAAASSQVSSQMLAAAEEIGAGLDDSVEVAAENAPMDDSAQGEEIAAPIAEDAEQLALAEGEPESFESQEIASELSLAPIDRSLVQVYGIHYDSQPDRDRVVVLSENMVEYEVHRPDRDTFIVSLLDATISPEAAGRLHAKPRGPISVITAFQQPDVAEPEVRVVVKRATDLEPTITRRGALLFLDFEKTGSIAAPAPAFPDAGDDPTVVASASSEMPAGDQLASASVSEQLEGSAPEVLRAAPGEIPLLLPEYVENAGLDGSAGMDMELALPEPELAQVADAFPGPAALEPPASADILEEGGLIDGKEYAGRRISLDFKDVAVADVLRLIAEVSDLNMIAGDEVQGNITIRLVDVPWDQALDVILLTKGLGFVRIGNVLRIAPAGIIRAEEEVRFQERRNMETLEDLVVKLQPINYGNVSDMSDLVRRLLTARGTVNTDERTSTLIIKDIPSVIDEATALVKAIDTETPQVLIEAKIVEANLDFSRELGSIWKVGTNQYEDGYAKSGYNRGLGGPDFRFIDENSVAFGNSITSMPTALGSFAALILDEQFNVEVQIQAAESTGDGKVISSPRVITLDNREAEIQQGVSIPFQTFENGDAKLEFVDAVLSLLVTPHITADKSIIMQIEVTRNAPDDTVATPTGSPAIARAEARTETLVKDGQTLVLGGIYTVVKSQREKRVPYLHRIPLLGAAFKSREITDSRKELLIFVTPRIVVRPELTPS